MARRPAAAGDPTHARFAAQSHSIVDNLVALFEHSRAWNCSSDILECGRIPSNRVARGAAPAIWPSGPQVFVEPVQRTLPAFLGGGFVIPRGRIVMETVIGALIDVAATRATSCERAATRSARVPQPLPRPRRPRRRRSRQGRCRYPHRSCRLGEALSTLSEGQFLGHNVSIRADKGARHSALIREHDG